MTQRYSKYKDSGIGWLGEIPEHWTVRRLGRLGYFSKGGGVSRSDLISENGFPAILYGDIYTQYEIRVINIARMITKAAFENGAILKRGDLLFTGSGETKEDIGKCVAFLSNEDCVAGGDVIILRGIKGYSLYFAYCLNHSLMKSEKAKISKGEIVVHIYASSLKTISLPLPPLPEQETIAQFLDEKRARIDEAVRIKEKQIELLKEYRQIAIHKAITKGLNDKVKMKDSGIDWIGEIPEHWEVKKVKEVANLYGRIGFRGYSTSDLVPEGEGAITISPSNIEGHRMHFSNNTYLSWEKYYESPEIMIFENDILIVKTGSTVGKVGFVRGLNEKATINPQLLVVKNIRENVEFLFQYLHSTTFFDLIKSNAIGSTIPTISESKIGNLPVVVPPLSEQAQIVAHLETLTAKTDEAIRLKEQQIEQLKQYKNALINEVVTGKVRVA